MSKGKEGAEEGKGRGWRGKEGKSRGREEKTYKALIKRL